MTTASCPLATALWGARFAGDWLPSCYTTWGDTTAPSESILKENLRCLYQLINGEDPAKVFPKGMRPTRKRPAKKRQKAK